MFFIADDAFFDGLIGRPSKVRVGQPARRRRQRRPIKSSQCLLTDPRLQRFHYLFRAGQLVLDDIVERRNTA